MGRVTRRTPRTRFDLAADPPRVVDRPDTVVVEEPLAVRVAGTEVATTMRTPGDDFDLALGHLLTEGLIGSGEDVAGMMHCTDTATDGSPTFNVVDVTLAPGVTLRREPGRRTTTATSACGLCGEQSVDEALARVPSRPAADGPVVDPRAVPGWVAALRERQTTFARTGGVHAAALVDMAGRLLVVREDVGRHNAVDKVLGWALRTRRFPLDDVVLLVSSRAGFEIVSKAAVAGVPVVVAVSAPSSLAVEMARRSGTTLVAFAREDSLSAYAHPHRLRVP